MVLSEPSDERQADARDDERPDHRLGDLGRRAEKPDQPDEEQDGSEEEPGREPEVAQPPGRGEHCGQLGQLFLVELNDVAGLSVICAARGAAALPVII